MILPYGAQRPVSVCVAPKSIAGLSHISRGLGKPFTVAVTHLRGCRGGLVQLIMGSIPPVMASISADVMLCRCRHLHRRPGNQ